MKKILLLAKMLSRAGGDAKQDSNQNSDVFSLFLTIILGLASFCIGMFITPMSHDIISNTTILTMLSVAAALASLVIIIPTIINSLFMSKDTQVLLTFPYSPFELALSNSINVIKSEGMFIAAATLPFVLGCFLGDSTDLIKLIVLSLLLIIFVTIYIVFLLILLITLVIKAVKSLVNKEMQKILGVIFGAIGLIAIYVLSISNKGNPSQEDVNAIINTVNNISAFTYIIPVAPMLKNFVCNLSFLNLIFALMIDGVIVFLAFFTLNKLYLPILKQVSNTFNNAQEVTQESIAQSVKSNSIVNALVVKDLKLICRDSSYYLYGIITPIIVGIFFEIIFFQLIGSVMSSIPQEIRAASSIIFGCSIGIIVTVGTVLYSGISACSLSREGLSYIFMKQVPIDYKIQISAKRKVALIMSVPATILIIFGFSIFGLITHLFSWTAPIIALITMLPMAVFFCNKSIFIDLKKPNLYVTNFKKLTSPKTSIAIIGLLLVFASLVLPFLIFIVLGSISDASGPGAATITALIFALTIVVIFVILAIVSNKSLYKRGPKLINNL